MCGHRTVTPNGSWGPLGRMRGGDLEHGGERQLANLLIALFRLFTVRPNRNQSRT